MLRVSPAAGSSVSAPPPPHQQWPQLEGQFAANGYCVVRGVLDPPSIDQMRAALAESRSQHPEDWTTYGMSRDGGPVGESGRWQTSKPLAHSSAFDAVVAHPAVLPLVRRIMGNPCITGVGACVRDPVHDPAPAPGEQWPPGTAATAPWPEGSEIHWAMFHREMGGLHLPSHPYACPSVQVRFQLDDCDGSTHTMSTVPESVEAKRALPTEPRGDYYSQITGQFIVDSWRNMHLPEAVDIHVNAGDVIILNNSNIHCGTVRRTSQARRDVNVGYGHKGLSLSGRESRVNAFPPRILEVVQREDLLDVLPPVTAPAPEWNTKASALGGGHVVGTSGLDVLDEHDPRRQQQQVSTERTAPRL